MRIDPVKCQRPFPVSGVITSIGDLVYYLVGVES